MHCQLRQKQQVNWLAKQNTNNIHDDIEHYESVNQKVLSRRSDKNGGDNLSRKGEVENDVVKNDVDNAKIGEEKTISVKTEDRISKNNEHSELSSASGIRQPEGSSVSLAISHTESPVDSENSMINGSKKNSIISISGAKTTGRSRRNTSAFSGKSTLPL